jgi:hypothetical protein
MATELSESLGEQTINKDGFEFDLKIIEGYLKYSAELLRLSYWFFGLEAHVAGGVRRRCR